MSRTTIWRGMGITVACVGAVLVAPAGAMALSTHSATSSTPNSDGVLVATAKCGANEHVVSGGFKSLLDSSAIVSRAVHGDSWTVHQSPVDGPLTTFAYCARKGKLSTSRHEAQVTATTEGVNTTATAHCGSGEKVVSGGYVMSPTTATDHNSPNFRDHVAGAGKWTVMSAFAEPPGHLEALVYCAHGVVVKVRSKSSAPIDDETGGSATASCHKGETLLAGGYTTKPTPDFGDTDGPDFFYGSSYRSAARSWTASVFNFSKVAGTITAFVYCMT